MKIKPLNFRKSLLLTLIPAGTAALVIHWLISAILRKNEMPFLYLYLPWWLCFMGLYFAAGLIAYKLEGNSLKLMAFKKRYRLRKIEGEDWRWLGALMGIFIIAVGLLNILGVKLPLHPLTLIRQNSPRS